MSPIPFDVELQLRRHGAALRSLAGELVKDPWVADDAVQEVWLSALRRPPPHEAGLGGWLATALRNVVRGLCRKQRRGERRERAVADARGAFAEDHAGGLAREEQAQRLLAAVRTLQPPFRDAIWQRYFEGKAPRAIAAASGVPCATVKSRLQRGLQQLRERLGKDGDARWRGALAVAFGWQGTALPGVLLMTTGTKVMAGTAMLAAAGVLWWSLAERGAPASAPSPAGTEPVATASADGAVARDADADAGAQRTLLTPDTPTADAAFREVRVQDEAGAPVPGATVWFVKPGWAYADLPAEQADRYSRSTESWLRDYGLARLTDERGSTTIPVAAAQQVVVARKGDLYGTNWPRSDGAFQPIVVTAHHTLVVETVDALGAPVPRVTVVGQRVANGPVKFNALNPLGQWTIGTTDEFGRVTTILEPPSGSDDTAQIELFAGLLDGPHGKQTIDAKAPPTFVRLVLPATGTVHARIRNADGSVPDRRTLESLHAELGVVGAQPQPTMFLLVRGPSEALRYERLDAEGNACFTNVAFGKKLQLRFPSMVVTPKVFEGPTAAQRDVTVVHTIDADHPFVVGTLVDPDGRPVGDATFTVMAPHNPKCELAVAGKTDAHGQFVRWLTDRCTGQREVVLQFGMDWVGTSPTREVSVRTAGPLIGKVDLGTVVMPDPK